jgi:hypothetical protein
MVVPAARRPWQFHLSTLILLSFLSGALMLGNRTHMDTEPLNRSAACATMTPGAAHAMWFKHSGWPIEVKALYVDGRLINPEEAYPAVALNVVFALVVLATIALAAERLARRSASRRALLAPATSEIGS